MRLPWGRKAVTFEEHEATIAKAFEKKGIDPTLTVAVAFTVRDWIRICGALSTSATNIEGQMAAEYKRLDDHIVDKLNGIWG